jgi:Fe-S-cluster-containing dehydrogenase component
MEGIERMAKYGMVIDISRCTGCYCCFTACKDEYWDNDYPPYSAAQPRFGEYWINVNKKERGTFPCIKVAYVPVPCQHCEDAPCLKVARDGAITRRADGIVLIDPEKAKGQKQIVDACPYHAIFWNEEKQIAQKCTFCVHRLEEGKEPRCVQTCPSGALKFGDLDDPKSEVSQLVESGKTEGLRPELNTHPRVLYMNVPKMFLAGTVVYADKDECFEGASVTVNTNGNTKKIITNAFGDFMFDGLTNQQYSVKIEAEGYQTHTSSVNLATDNYLGVIKLAKS